MSEVEERGGCSSGTKQVGVRFLFTIIKGFYF